MKLTVHEFGFCASMNIHILLRTATKNHFSSNINEILNTKHRFKNKKMIIYLDKTGMHKFFKIIFLSVRHSRMWNNPRTGTKG
jgi:hypothetical protein